MSVILAALLALGLVPAIREPHPSAALRAGVRPVCGPIYTEARAQGASDDVAYRLTLIGWRESGCTVVYVDDSDDLAASRLGINFRTAALARGWGAWCDAWTRWATVDLTVDIRCALAAYAHEGWRPWTPVPW